MAINIKGKDELSLNSDADYTLDAGPSVVNKAIDLVANPADAISFLSTLPVTTDAAGKAQFKIKGVKVNDNIIITATQQDDINNTGSTAIKVLADDTDIILVAEARGWAADWENTMIRLTARVQQQNRPVNGEDVLFSSSDPNVEWSVANGTVKTQPDGRAVIMAKIKGTPNSSITFKAKCKDVESSEYPILLLEETSKAPIIPFMDDGIIDQNEIDAGVQVNIRLDETNADPSVLYFFIDNNEPYLLDIAPHQDRAYLKLNTADLTPGRHVACFYVKNSFDSNVSFSSQTELLVHTDNGSGAISDLPQINVPLADNDGSINMFDKLSTTVSFKGLSYNGVGIFDNSLVDTSTPVTINWTAFDENGKQLPEGQGSVNIETTVGEIKNDEVSIDESDLDKLGRGRVQVSYYMNLKTDNQTHVSEPKSILVDVIPPSL